MDITSLFKASVKTVRTRIKALGSTKPAESELGNRILNRPIRDSKFQAKAKEIVSIITKFQDLLVENRKAYLDAGVSLFSKGPSMTAGERADMDASAQIFMKTCSQLLKELKKESGTAANAQSLEHRQIVISIVESYLKRVSNGFHQQKELYTKRQNELQKISRLEQPEGLNWGHQRKASFGMEYQSNSTCDSSAENGGSSSGRIQVPYNQDIDKEETSGNNSFTVEEMQLYEKENALLYNELNSLSEEVKQIQGRVVKIAELQQTITEKVLEQDVDVERIATTTVGATENIREGNEQLRQAMQNNSGFRIALIFFILVLSFSLLFLDWYNE